MKSTIFIPKLINVGYQNRKDTYTGKLAYVVYTWSAWKYVAWTIPYGNSKFVNYYWKTVRGKLYIMAESKYDDEIERYEVTPAVKELLGI